MIETYKTNLLRELKGKKPETLLILGSGLGTLADEIKNKIEVQFDNGTIPDVAFEGFKILLDKLIEAKDSLAI